MENIVKSSIVVGVDVHKYSHYAVALNCFGSELSTLQFTNDEKEKCLSWLQTFGDKKNIIVALEDVHGLGLHLSTALQSAGFSLRYVPAIYTEKARKHSVHKDKNDYLDAKRVGKVILQNMEETLPAGNIVSQQSTVIRSLDLLLQEREELTREQTALKNQLHALLHQYFGNGYKQSFKTIFTQKAQNWYTNYFSNISEETTTPQKRYLAGSVLRRLKRLAIIMGQIKEITQLIEETEAIIPEVKLLTNGLTGCGILTACKIMVEIGDIARFLTEAKLAKYAGIAPVQAQSGKRNRFYTNNSGNRKLNRAIHTIALSQIGNRGSEEGKKYFHKKVADGKSKLWALRCLKRFITRRIFVLLSQPITNTTN